MNDLKKRTDELVTLLDKTLKAHVIEFKHGVKVSLDCINHRRKKELLPTHSSEIDYEKKYGNKFPLYNAFDNQKSKETIVNALHLESMWCDRCGSKENLWSYANKSATRPFSMLAEGVDFMNGYVYCQTCRDRNFLKRVQNGEFPKSPEFLADSILDVVEITYAEHVSKFGRPKMFPESKKETEV